jgi:DNA-binding transcriptional ArsR family regulator
MNSPLRSFKADIFQALAHPTRIAVLELLEAGELSAGSLIEKLGIEQANVSQHLAVLRSKQLVNQRKAGTQVFYSLRDPVIGQVLRLMKDYFYAHLKESRATLDDLETESKLPLVEKSPASRQGSRRIAAQARVGRP